MTPGRWWPWCGPLIVLVLAVTACAGDQADGSGLADLPATSVTDFSAHLQSLDRPAVVNVWASWCLPCRSEAPLLDRAFEVHGDRIEFIGVDVADDQTSAKSFLAEFGLYEFDHFFDPDRAIPNFYGGFGTPLTFFFGPGGELVSTHNGVIDERALALGIDEISTLVP
jgi:thiol-disulfide isomerase/thioredoxin